MRLLVFLSLVSALSVPAFAGTHPFSNDREGKSYLLTKADKTAIEVMRKSYHRSELEAAVSAVFNEFPADRAQSACAFDMVTKLKAQQGKFSRYNGKSALFLKTLRYEGLIDDVFLRINLRALSLSEKVAPGLRDDFEAPARVESLYWPFVDFSVKRARGKCLPDNFRELVSAFRQRTKTITSQQVIAWADEANRLGFITDRAQSELQAAGLVNMDSWEIGLGEYASKREFLRTQFPLTRGAEHSEFMALKAGKTNSSHRLKLYEQYSSLQIAMMGDVIKKLRARLDSPKIEITVHDNDDRVVEVITLDPMERFRFSIKVLRKEMRLLAINSYFNGRQPAYTDLMAAGYEMGVVTAKELDEVAKLEQIWNPKKTFLQKVTEWVRMFGGVLSIVVPQPFGFIPSLAMIGMEAVANETGDDTTDSLF